MIRIHAIGSCAACAIALSACASQENYLALQAGGQDWAATSNSDAIEADSAIGWMAGAAGGVRLEAPDLPVGARLELELAHRENGIHGYNPPGERNSADHMDGNVMRVTSLMASAWPEIELHERIRIYAGGGLGGAWMTALEQEGGNLSWQVGAGLAARLTERIELDLGYRWFEVLPTRLDGLEAEYRAHGPVVRIAIINPGELVSWK